MSGLPAKSNPRDNVTVGIDLDSAYPLPLNLTATLKISPDATGKSDLGFAGGARTLDITIPANTRHFDVPFNVGSVAGTIQFGLNGQAGTLTTVIDPSAPTISNVTVASTSGGFTVTISGVSTTREMKTATFQFTAAGGSKLDTTTATVDVSGIFGQYFQDAQSFANGGRFTLAVPFTVAGDTKAISGLSVTLTNSVGTSAAASASVQ